MPPLFVVQVQKNKMDQVCLNSYMFALVMDQTLSELIRELIIINKG